MTYKEVMPPLPEPDSYCTHKDSHEYDVFSSDQMHAYAKRYAAALAQPVKPLSALDEYLLKNYPEAKGKTISNRAINVFETMDTELGMEEVAQRAEALTGSAQQSWELHIEQADAIRGLLDLHAPQTEGNLQMRLAQVLAQPVQPAVSDDEILSACGEFAIDSIGKTNLIRISRQLLNFAAIARPVQLENDDLTAAYLAGYHKGKEAQQVQTKETK